MQIGNPLLEFNTDFNAEDEYNWSHGVISDSSYELLTSYCNTSQMIREAIRGNLSDACSIVNDQISKEISDFIDVYDVIADVCIPSNSSLRFDIAKHPLFSRFQISSSRGYTKAQSLSQQVNQLLFLNMSGFLLLWFLIYICLVITNIVFCYPLNTARLGGEDRCLCGTENKHLLKQERCTNSSPCPACWSSSMGFL